MIFFTLESDDTKASLIGKAYESNKNWMIGYAKKHLEEYKGDAEDVVQEVFKCIFASPSAFPKKEEEARLYLLVCLKHQIARTRQGLDKFYFSRPINPASKSAEDEAVKKIIYNDIVKFVNSLPENEGGVFIMRVILGIKSSSVAKIFEIDKKTVSSRVRSVTKKIKERFGDLYE